MHLASLYPLKTGVTNARLVLLRWATAVGSLFTGPGAVAALVSCDKASRLSESHASACADVRVG